MAYQSGTGIYASEHAPQDSSLNPAAKVSDPLVPKHPTMQESAERERLERERNAADQKKHAEEAQRAADKQKADAEKNKHSNESSQEKAEREKVEREKDIMRDPHEHDAKKAAKTGPNPMPKFRDKEGNIVSALRIKEVKPLVHPDKNNKYELHFVEAGFGPVKVSAPWVTANLPKSAGWFVADATGTRYMNAQEFATKYQERRG
jgi:hypothetical protein